MEYTQPQALLIYGHLRLSIRWRPPVIRKNVNRSEVQLVCKHLTNKEHLVARVNYPDTQHVLTAPRAHVGTGQTLPGLSMGHPMHQLCAQDVVTRILARSLE